MVITNYRPETLKKWKIDYSDLVKMKENLVMIHFSAFGTNGPYSEKTGFARVAESFSGLTYMTGYPDRKPIFSGYPIADALAGVYGAFSVILALYHFKQTGEGQLVDLSLYEPLIRIMENYIMSWKEKCLSERVLITPLLLHMIYMIQKIISGLSFLHLHKIFRKISDRYRTSRISERSKISYQSIKSKKSDELDEYFISFFSEHTLEHSREIMEKHGVAYSPVNSVADLFNDPHFKTERLLFPLLIMH